MSGINLDAILGEEAARPLTYKGATFSLPGELPGAVLAPFLNEDLGIIELVSDAVMKADEDASIIDVVFDTLKNRPSLPAELLSVVKEAFAALLGDDYEAFMALRPSVPAFFALGKSLVEEYGVGLLDFFESGDSSETDGTTSKETSPATTPDSTPEASGDDPEPKDS